MGAVLGFITLPLVTRALNADGLGVFDYSTESMRILLDLLSFGVPTATFAWISRESGEKGKAGVIFGVLQLLVAIALSLFVLAVVATSNTYTMVWPNTNIRFLLFALVVQGFILIQTFVTQWADGIGQTIVMERLRSVQNILRALAIVVLAASGSLSLETYFHLQWIFAALFIALAGRMLWTKSGYKFSGFGVDRAYLREVKLFVIRYVTPLLLASSITFAVDYLTGWMLQKYGGAVARGHFGLGSRIGNIIFLFASALTPIMIRELAVAAKESDNGRIAHLFERSKTIVFITAALGIFSAVNANDLTAVIGGGSFQSANLAVAIYCLYPIHQVFGQLTGSYFLASGQTKTFSILGVAFALLSLPLGYVLLAPQDNPIPGFWLGATGRSAQLVIIQLLTTNTMLYLVSKNVGMRYLDWLKYQVLLIISCLVSAKVSTLIGHSISNYALSIIPNLTGTPLMRTLVVAMTYGILLLIFLVMDPRICGLDRNAFNKLGTDTARWLGRG